MSWLCQVCSASYICLYDLVGHTRAAHCADTDLQLICQVNQCPKTFANTNTWYKHVVKMHSGQYYASLSIPSKEDNSSDTTEEDEHENEFDDENLLLISDSVTSNNCGPPSIVMPTFTNEEKVVEKLLCLKEKHRLSQIAIAEVVELIKSVCDSTITKSLTAISLSGEACGMDMGLNFFQELPELLEGINYPMRHHIDNSHILPGICLMWYAY